MRNLLILLVLLLGGYWLYQHFLVVTPPAPTSQSSPQTVSSDQFALPDPVAFKLKILAANRPEVVEVWLIHGDRWRREARRIGFPGTDVSIFDGSRLVWTDLKVIQTKGMGPGLRTMMSAINGAKPAASELRDGRQCWLFKSTLDPIGNRADLWVDQETHLPVLLSGWQSGIYDEAHFQFLKSDFSILEPACFDTSNTTPMLTPFLTP